MKLRLKRILMWLIVSKWKIWSKSQTTFQVFSYKNMIFTEKKQTGEVCCIVCVFLPVIKSKTNTIPAADILIVGEYESSVFLYHVRLLQRCR